jgi:acyl-CoA synthetase (AMP-forming)/AMP-acid ligase II
LSLCPPVPIAGWFQRHAVTRPERSAIVTPRARLTYAEFYRALLVSARRLEEAHIEQGQVVAICVQSHALHCVLLAALDRLGVVSISLNPPKRAGETIDAPEGVRIDRFLFEPPFIGVAPANSLFVGLEWLKPTGNETPDLKSPGFRDEHAMMRILTTSGTTGMAKAIGFSSRQWESRVLLYSVGLLAEGRSGPTISLFGVASAGGFRIALETFWAGGTLFLGWPAESVAEVISQNKIVRAYGSPATYQSVVERSNPDLFDLSSLRYALATGSVTSAPLVAAIRRKFCRTYLVLYGSTEMGMVSYGVATPNQASGSSGVLVPWVQAQAVNEEGKVMPPGVEGVLRFSSEDMATSYLNDPKASAEHFRDGWFYPGDLGVISETRTLTITGRSNERINAGGVKTSPERIEDVITAYDGIAECAAFGVPDAGGVDQIWVAIVANAPVDIDGLRTYCATKLGPRAPKRFLKVAKLPRNENGKILRSELADLARRGEIEALSAGGSSNGERRTR